MSNCAGCIASIFYNLPEESDFVWQDGVKKQCIFTPESTSGLLYCDVVCSC